MALGNPNFGSVSTDGTYEKLEKLMRKVPTKLYTRLDIMGPLKKEEKAAQNALDYLWRKGTIWRHKDKAENDKFQYAIKISENNRVAYEPTYTARSSGGGIQAINKLCDQIIANTIQLQQMVTETIEEMKDDLKGMEELKKIANKLKNIDI